MHNNNNKVEYEANEFLAFEGHCLLYQRNMTSLS